MTRTIYAAVVDPARPRTMAHEPGERCRDFEIIYADYSCPEESCRPVPS
jgi:hypothetical protein